MSNQLDPVKNDESVLRRIPKKFVNFDLEVPIQRIAFEPNIKDTDGISVFRELFITASRLVSAGRSPNGYHVSSIVVDTIIDLSLTVIPDPTEDLPGHSLIPENNYISFCDRTLKKKLKALQRELAKIASQNII